MSTDIAPRATIAQLVGVRDRALKQAEEAFALVQRVNRIALGVLSDPVKHRYRVPDLRVEISGRGRHGIEGYRQMLDAAAWRDLMDYTDLRNLMGVKQRNEWEDQLEKDPPEFTLETAVATFTSLRADAGAIFRRSVVDTFEALPREFRSHDGFKLGARCVLTYAVNGRGWTYSSWMDRRAMLRDLDRALHTVTGEAWTEHADDVADVAMKAGATECETRFFRLRWFNNGNMHVWFADKDAARQLNKILADHYGPRLGWMHLHPDEQARREAAA